MNRSERMAQLLADAGIASIRKLSELSGVRFETIRAWGNEGRKTLRDETNLDTVCATLGNANPSWLWSEAGPRYLGTPPYRARIREAMSAMGLDPAGFDRACQWAHGTAAAALGGKTLSHREAGSASSYTSRPLSWFLDDRPVSNPADHLQVVVEGIALALEKPALLNAMPKVLSYLRSTTAPDPEIVAALIYRHL